MKFSIIMPTYNCEKYVGEAVNSVLEQIVGDFELIIVDDGSKDRTFDICKRLSAGRNNVHLFAAEHGGVSKARNFGLAKASGDYVLFVDCDDTWEKDLLESVCSLLDEKSELVLFGMGHDYYLSDDSFQYHQANLGDCGQVEVIEIDENVNKLISAYNMSSPCNKVYKRELIEKNSLAFSERCVYLEDLKFNFDYLQHITAFKLLRRDLYHYRLFTDKKQMLKRNFGEPFVNADELYISAKVFVESRGVEFKDSNVIVGILLTAYINELLARSESASAKELNELLKALNKNKSFCSLIKVAKGKFNKLVNFLRIFGAYKLQFKLIKKHKKI